MDALSKLRNIEKDHPKVYEWIKAKAKWEGMTLMGVLSYYEKDVEKMLESEEIERVRRKL